MSFNFIFGFAVFERLSNSGTKSIIEKRDNIMTENLAKTIVLVHGGFVDGSGWESVYKILKNDSYNVAVVQNPTT